MTASLIGLTGGGGQHRRARRAAVAVSRLRAFASAATFAAPYVFVAATLCVLFVRATARGQGEASSSSSSQSPAQWSSSAESPPSPGNADVAGYRGRVRQAAGALESLLGLTKEAQTEGGSAARARLQSQTAGTLGEVRRLLPAGESVRLGDGSSLDAANRWLHIELQAYDSLLKSGGDYPAQQARLAEMSERLRALDVRLEEYEKALKSSAGRDKDADKGRLAAILRGPDFQKETARGGAIGDLIERIKRWLESLFNRPGPRPAAGTGFSTAAQVIIFSLALGVFGFVLWRFWRTRRGRAPRITLGREPRVVLGERIEPGETAGDLLAAAERLARAGDLRGAIRKAYVALLCELGDRKVIRLAQHKTNRDYLQAVRQLAPQLYTFMRPLTFNFERHWYGFESATEDDWRDFLTGCRRTLDEK